MIEPLIYSVMDSSVGEEAGKTPFAGIDEHFVAVHIQETLVLPSKTGCGHILCRRRAAYRDAKITAVFVPKGPVGREDFIPKVFRQRRPVHNLACLAAALGQVRDIAGIDSIQGLVQLFPGIRLVQHIPVGLGRDAKAVGHFDTFGNEFPVHFSQRGRLATDQWNVLHPQILEESDVFEFLTHALLLLPLFICFPVPDIPT